MRKKAAASLAVFGMMVLGGMASSCDLLGIKQKGEIHILISENGYRVTKSSFEIPDTNDFILEITDPNGEPVYYGPYGQSYDSYSVEEGECKVSVASGDIAAPAFETPVFGDMQTVNVMAGKTTNVKLSCRQINSGLRLKRDMSFLEKYPDASIVAKCGKGSLSYGQGETRIGYFPAETVTLSVVDKAEEIPLTEYTLERQTILTLTLSVIDRENGKSEMICAGIDIDTTRIWKSDNFVLGGSKKGDSADNPMDIREAKASAGSKGIWVYGFIVGGDMSSSGTGISFEPPFTSNTHIAIASRANANDKASCMSVQLSSGTVRDALNLADRPENLGKQIYIKGDIVNAYFGVPGIKNVTEYIIR